MLLYQVKNHNSFHYIYIEYINHYQFNSYFILSGHEDAAEVLILYGAEINATDKDSLTPLHWAVRTGECFLFIL